MTTTPQPHTPTHTLTLTLLIFVRTWVGGEMDSQPQPTATDCCWGWECRGLQWSWGFAAQSSQQPTLVFQSSPAAGGAPSLLQDLLHSCLPGLPSCRLRVWRTCLCPQPHRAFRHEMTQAQMTHTHTHTHTHTCTFARHIACDDHKPTTPHTHTHL